MKYSKTGSDNATRLTRVVKVYDVNQKSIIGEFETLRSAATFTGVLPRNIRNLIKSKGRSHTNKLNKVICFR